ncbi:copper resistance protein CopC [Phycicoccus sp. BSK3Z-2]|uniref:Copper resistance protein CopC n=1 Tax=Phycicoccus avicenniae TaxID=2828860 RepID=A0A941D885_9MICO|nr:copper resistance CopC family protein [Phycicoccus avicenniae]MBR7742908.1 copper resistance protein CopC [Phycicoccus avicenniae]
MFTRRMSTAVAVVVVAAVILALVASFLPALAAPRPAALPAHAQLLGSSPQDGASVDTADEVVLSFNEEVGEDFLQVVVEGPDGDEADGAARVDGRDVVQPLAADLPAGEHTVTYRVVSVDGHPVSGSVTFTTTQEPETAEPTPSAEPSTSAAPSPSASAEPTPEATATTSPDTEETAATSSGTPAWLIVSLLVLALALVAVTGLVVRRARDRQDG